MENKNHNINTDPIDNHLKNKLNELGNQAPNELWNRINHGLEEDDSLIDQKLREYYSGINKEAPESIWYSIEKQLNIDLVWSKLGPSLDKLKLFHVWKNRLKKLSVAALLLLLIRGCGVDLWMYNLSNNNSSLHTLKSSESNSNDRGNKSSEIISKSKVHADYGNETMKITDGVVEENIILTKNILDVYPEENLNKVDQNENNILLDNKDFENKNELLSAQENEELNKQNNRIIHVNSVNYSLIKLNEKNIVNDLLTVRLNHKNPFLRLKFDLGLVSTIQQIFLKNDLNAKILSNYVPSSSSSTLGYAYGLSLGFNFNHRHAFISELLINSKMRQDYVYQHNGKVNRETVDFDYLKFNLLYKYNIIGFGATRRNVLSMSSGVYLSHLKNNNTNSPISSLRNNSTLQINIPQLNNWDWGFLANVGMEHSLQRNLLFEYGIRTDIGMGSVYKPNSNFITVNGISNFIGLGFYSTLKYRF